MDYSCAEPNWPFGTVSPVAGGLWLDSYQALVKLQRQAADPAPKVCSRACIATLPHDLGPGIVLSADIVSRHFMHVPQGGGSIDATASARKYFERAIEKDPNYAVAYAGMGEAYIAVERNMGGRNTINAGPSGKAAATRALALDPLSPYVRTEAGEALLLAGRYAEAVEQFRTAIKLDPSRNKPYNSMARTLYLQGKFVEALTARDESLKRGAPPDSVDWMACVEVGAGRREQAVVLLQQLKTGRAFLDRARIYACIGEQEQALAFLENALAENEPGLPELLQSPELASLRPNARFAALRRSVNLNP